MVIRLEYTDAMGAQNTVTYPENVMSIDLSGLGYIEIDLTPLEQCTHLQKLDLRVSRFVSNDLSALKACKNLEVFSLTSTQFRQIDLEPLVECTKLREILLWLRDLKVLDLNPFEFLPNLQRFELMTNSLEHIDLSPFGHCSNLQSLNLKMNRFQSVDLRPLSSCPDLEVLHLMMNQLSCIDLEPLHKLTRLESISLGANQLKSINLTPLSSCSNLRKFEITGNNLQTVDLRPLGSCTKLEELFLGQNQIHSIDISSLISKPTIIIDDNCRMHSWLKMKNAVYERPICRYSWPFLQRIVQVSGTDRRVQHDIIYAMGLKDCGFFERNLQNILISIPAEISIEEVRKHVVDLLLEDIAEAVDRRESITGFRVEEFYTYSGEIAARTKSIIELQSTEMENVVVKVDGNNVDLRELFLTSYGYNILNAMNMKLTTDLKGLEQVKKSLSEIGFDLKTGESSRTGVNMSDDLKKVIWWIVRNRGEKWEVIREP